MKRAFTLIELLIVIAIIAVLALIALPNFLEAQTRAKSARVQADFRSIATALEAYFVDYNNYPIGRNINHSGGYFKAYSDGLYTFTVLSTPISYITNPTLQDPFRNLEDTAWERTSKFVNIQGAGVHLNTEGASKPRAWTSSGTAPNIILPAPLKFNGKNSKLYNTMWILANVGPDRDYSDPQNDKSGNIDPGNVIKTQGDWNNIVVNGLADFYDPTNGTMSRGNIYRFSGSNKQ